MRAFDITISICENTQPPHRPPVWKRVQRVVRVNARSSAHAWSQILDRTNMDAVVVRIVDIWD